MRIAEEWISIGRMVKYQGKYVKITNLDCWCYKTITWVYSITIQIEMKNIKVEPYKVSR